MASLLDNHLQVEIDSSVATSILPLRFIYRAPHLMMYMVQLLVQAGLPIQVLKRRGLNQYRIHLQDRKLCVIGQPTAVSEVKMQALRDFEVARSHQRSVDEQREQHEFHTKSCCRLDHRESSITDVRQSEQIPLNQKIRKADNLLKLASRVHNTVFVSPLESSGNYSATAHIK